MKFLPQFIFRSPLGSCRKEVEQNEFGEALYLSSPALYEEYRKFLAGQIKEEKEIRKLNISLYKYRSRSSFRCTPFGLFAGLSIGTWAEENNVILDKDLKKTLKRKTRLDMNVLCALAQQLAKLPCIKPQLRFFPNNTLYKVGDTYRYVEYYYLKERRIHKISSVDYSEYLEMILKESKKGLTQLQLSALLVSEEISEEEAFQFTEELIAAQLLTNQLEPTVTGPDYFEVLMQELEHIYALNADESLKETMALLREVNAKLMHCDSNTFNETKSYREIHHLLKQLLPDLQETNLVQTDLYKKTVEKKLDNNIQLQLTEAIKFLAKISPVQKNKQIEDFIKRFTENYEDAEVSLLFALDTETGIGYPAKNDSGINDLVEDIYATYPAGDSEVKWNVLQAQLLRLLMDSVRHNKKVIEISEADFKGTDFSVGTQLPPSYSVMFKVLDAKTNKLDLGGNGGSSAINLLGRFAGGDEELLNMVRTIADFEKEQYPGKIIAEIVHLPESRTGNVLARPQFRKYEIPYLAKSSAEEEFQINVSDLYLKIRGGKIILFDKRLKKEIIPRLGNAHNFANNSLPLYHFLCDLQTHYFSRSFLGFNWGVLSNQFAFLPRVEYKNTVLSAARWQLQKTDIEVFQKAEKNLKEKRDAFFKLKDKIELPERFLIVDGDNELLIDCRDEIAVETFIDTCKNRTNITLEEYLFNEEAALVNDQEGNPFTNECIAVLLTESENKQIVPGGTASKTHSSTRTFFTGTEWLYYKIYCGAKTADQVLADKIKPIADELLQRGIIDSWFFIRYHDPDTHLRVRFHLPDVSGIGEIVQLMHLELGELVHQRIISKIQTDTYKREIERYGDSSMETVEQLFFYDSVFVSEMLQLIDAENGGVIRWQMALRSVDALLNDFEFSVEQKYDLISRLSNSFFNEHGGQKELKLQLDNKFRALRPKVEEILRAEIDAEKEYFPLIEALNKRNESNKSASAFLLQLNQEKALQVNLYDLLASILHMNLDRLFMGRNRSNEFVVYDLLARHYKSVLARAKSGKAKTNSIHAAEQAIKS